MMLTDEEMEILGQDGYLLLPNRIDSDDLDGLKERAICLEGVASEDRLLEVANEGIRSIHGCHLRDDKMSGLVKNPKLLLPAKQILGPEIYVYQFKINPKEAFNGGSWEWHQDYTHWKEEDDLPTSKLINVAVYLDDVTEFNGPIWVVPGSHRKSDLCYDKKESSGWSEEHRADIRYTVDATTIRTLISEHGLKSTIAPAGSILIFDVNLVHGSCENISPYGRQIAFVTYNRIDNKPRLLTDSRPEYLVGRDFSPL